MNGYIGIYKSKQYEVDANTSFEAQRLIAAQNKAKKPWEVSIYLAEKDSQPVTHIATD